MAYLAALACSILVSVLSVVEMNHWRHLSPTWQVFAQDSKFVAAIAFAAFSRAVSRLGLQRKIRKRALRGHGTGWLSLQCSAEGLAFVLGLVELCAGIWFIASLQEPAYFAVFFLMLLFVGDLWSLLSASVRSRSLHTLARKSGKLKTAG
jgi:hypothetical protein